MYTGSTTSSRIVVENRGSPLVSRLPRLPVIAAEAEGLVIESILAPPYAAVSSAMLSHRKIRAFAVGVVVHSLGPVLVGLMLTRPPATLKRLTTVRPQ